MFLVLQLSSFHSFVWILFSFFSTCECVHFPLYEVDEKGALKNRAKPQFVIHPSCPKHHATMGCGWPLQNYTEDHIATAKALYKRYETLVKDEERRVKPWAARVLNPNSDKKVFSLIKGFNAG